MNSSKKPPPRKGQVESDGTTIYRTREEEIRGRLHGGGWIKVCIGTAKCDFCQRQSRGVVVRCDECKISICRECSAANCLDGSKNHELDHESVDWEPTPLPGKRAGARKRVTRRTKREREAEAGKEKERENRSGRGTKRKYERETEESLSPARDVYPAVGRDEAQHVATQTRLESLSPAVEDVASGPIMEAETAAGILAQMHEVGSRTATTTTTAAGAGYRSGVEQDNRSARARQYPVEPTQPTWSPATPFPNCPYPYSYPYAPPNEAQTRATGHNGTWYTDTSDQRNYQSTENTAQRAPLSSLQDSRYPNHPEYNQTFYNGKHYVDGYPENSRENYAVQYHEPASQWTGGALHPYQGTLEAYKSREASRSDPTENSTKQHKGKSAQEPTDPSVSVPLDLPSMLEPQRFAPRRPPCINTDIPEEPLRKRHRRHVGIAGGSVREDSGLRQTLAVQQPGE